MKRFVLLASLFLVLIQARGQSLSGQWKGGFNSSGAIVASGQTQYVLELDIKGEEVSGYSYTYFSGYEKRYYVICRLTGSYDKKSKSVVVKEVQKVKSNTPPDFQDCLQTHSLTYMKGTDNREVLVGRWKPTRKEDNCGTGETELERKALVKVVPKTSSPATVSRSTPTTKPGSTAKTSTTAPKTGTTAGKSTAPAKTTAPPVAKASTPSTTKSGTQKTTASNSTKTTTPPETEVAKKPETIEKNLPSIEKPKAPSTIGHTSTKLNMRTKQLIKTVEVEATSFRVDLYDNGQIDGDTISVFYNGKLMVSRQRLSTNPISIQVTMDPSREDNELVMYAENLGTIPPNTALMVVTVAGKRYEVNISSSEQTSGTVRFKLANPAAR
jgi:hypothetical protein